MVAGFFELGEEASALWTLPSDQTIWSDSECASMRGRRQLALLSSPVWQLSIFGKVTIMFKSPRFAKYAPAEWTEFEQELLNTEIGTVRPFWWTNVCSCQMSGVNQIYFDNYHFKLKILTRDVPNHQNGFFGKDLSKHASST